ncbi:MAG: hypothetical protein DLM64_07035 [Solirubrobacterales bacterium]|nr:MAG: hypothetical protein DLM64_07035 [Solirubrobacterales bacterium]
MPYGVEAFERIADGQTPGAVGRWLNGQGIRTVRGAPFVQRTLRKVIENDAYLGQKGYLGPSATNWPSEPGASSPGSTPPSASGEREAGDRACRTHSEALCSAWPVRHRCTRRGTTRRRTGPTCAATAVSRAGSAAAARSRLSYSKRMSSTI